MPTPDQIARMQAAESMATALFSMWNTIRGSDPMQLRRVAVIADNVWYADLQAKQYRPQRTVLEQVRADAPEQPDGGCTDPHGVRLESAIHIAAAVKMAAGDVDQLAHWATVCRSLDVLWPESSSQARAILAGLLPKREDGGEP